MMRTFLLSALFVAAMLVLSVFSCKEPNDAPELISTISLPRNSENEMTFNQTARTALRNMIADCTAFRAWHGNSWTQAQARARIYTGGLPSPASDAAAHTLTQLNDYRPFVIVWTDEEEGLQVDHVAAAGTGGFNFAPTGMLIARFERLVDAADADATATAEEEMMDEMDAIIRSGDLDNPGMLELAGRAGYLAIESLTLLGPRRAPENERARFGDWIRAWMEVRWGVFG